MRIPGLSEETIVRHAEQMSVERGREYFHSGAVKSIKRTSDTEVEAYVQGSDVAPYHVEIRHNDREITAATCTCPYVGGAWCRHIVAALIAVVKSEGMLSRPIGEMLQDLDRNELIRLVESLIDLYPQIASVVEDKCERRRT